MGQLRTFLLYCGVYGGGLPASELYDAVESGQYTGGELAVEGELHEVRYRAVEFDGWKQVHWTLPFVGEWFSIVWFTPSGCAPA